ncbi:hypothetical protein [Hydrogenimonas sp.]
MQRALPLLSILLLFHTALFADSCFRFFPGSYVVIDGVPAYAVSKTAFVSLRCPEGRKVLAHDRLRGLCLFEGEAERPFLLTEAKPPLFFCPSKEPRKVTLLSYPAGIEPGRVKDSIGEEGALFSSCCRLAGIVDASGGWFGSDAIADLLRGRVCHADTGLRFAESEGSGVVVRYVDPYLSPPLLPGDRIVEAGGVREPSLQRLEKRIDRCAKGEALAFAVQRGTQRVEAEVPCRKRMGGGKLSDTFLERFGIWFDKKLRIVEIDPEGEAFAAGLRNGDRLLRIGSADVASQRDVLACLTRFAVKKSVPQNMLWERAGLQFFLALPSL